MWNKIDDACNGRTIDPIRIDWRRDHDRQFPCDLADQRLRYIDIALHGLFDIFPVGIILPVKDADPIHTNDISALEIVHGGALTDDGLFLLQRYRRIGQLRDAACIHGNILVSRQFVLNTSCRLDCRFAHHLLHCGECACVVCRNAEHSHRKQRHQDSDAEA